MIPVLLQNLITNFVSLLDNIMVGQVGTEQMSGVAISNQLVFVFNLFLFGGVSGAGIFAAQFFGKGDEEGVRQSVRMKLIIGMIGLVLFVTAFWTIGGNLITSFLHEGSEGLDLAVTYGSGLEYLRLMTIGMPPFALSFVYASTLRESGETMLPMKASIAAVLVNLVGNYILIFGKFGMPAMGVAGAAIATVISRYAELAILVIYSHRHKERFGFFKGLYSSLHIERSLMGRMIRKGTPLLVNEILWAAGMAMLNQCYSLRGIEVVSATNISSTVSNMFSCVVFSMGTTINIIIGQHLGAGKMEEAVRDHKKITALSVCMCIVVGIVLIFVSPLLADIYNTTDNVKHMASSFMVVIGIYMPVSAYINACYFTLRSGGKTVITFIFDSAFLWAGNILAAFILTRATDLPILTIFIIVNSMDLIKCAIGFFMVRSRKWVVNLVKDE
ncbi:MAG: MATE family efflux transporter [Parasporobacterium sp.]|nr:MATE family efflux transporter [Parasporobacterium sp.]